MQCVICKIGTTHKEKANITLERDGAFVIFSNVDAEVCDNCGEAYFDADTTIWLQKKAGEEFSKGKEVALVKL